MSLSRPYSPQYADSPQTEPLDADALESLFNPDPEDEYMPWGNNFDDFLFAEDDPSLGLPINTPNHNPNAVLPAFEAPFFDALPRIPSHDSFPQEQSATSSANSQPPRSNQQAHQSATPRHYRVAVPGASESSESFDEYLELTPSPPRMPSRPNVATRSSSVVDLTSSPVQSRREMAPESNKKRKRDGSGEGASKAAKARGVRSVSAKKEDLSNITLVDLSAVETDEQYEDFKAKEEARKVKEQEDLIKAQNQADADRPVKLAEFQCIICMDNPTDLTVTHCGHLFCSECLHSALYAGDKKCCPVCRTTINTKPVAGRQPKNGIFVLEMKLMTANKKGKQVVRTR